MLPEDQDDEQDWSERIGRPRYAMAESDEYGGDTPATLLKSRINGTIRSNGTSHIDTHSIASSSASSYSSSQFASSSSHPLLPPQSLLVQQTLSAGRGVFAAIRLSAGTLVEVSHVLLFPAKEYQEFGQHTELDSYTFVWSKGPEGKTMALALGLGSLFNHSHSSPNTNYTLDKSAGTIRYTLTRDVMPGEELFISYGVGKMWWEKSAIRGDGVGSSAEDEDMDDDGVKLENELFMLGQLGIDGEEREARPFRRREERRKHALMSNDDSPRPPSTPATTSLAPSPPILPPKSVGPDAAPLWRITAAVDPTTTPLELMAVWAVDIDPRKSANFMQFHRSIARRLRAAEEGGDGQEHMRREEQQSSQLDDDDDDDAEDDDSGDEDESMKHLRIFHRMGQDNCLTALVCRVQDVPSLEKVTNLLEKADVVSDGSRPRPFQVQAPKFPAPSRLRLPEWKAYWPVAVKHGRMLDASSKSSLLGISTNITGNSNPGIVDRGADARLWTKEATQWAATHFARCLALAKQAREQGELPIGVHVTPSYSDLDASTLGPDGHPWIQVDAWDTRQSERNSIKHGVTNAIRDVAKLRSDRDKERLQQLAVKGSTPAAPAPIREQRPKTPIDDVAACRNGQDYLLNGLTLFTTHEPCVSCCMALVHSRVRCIFFIKPSPGAGGCCGSGLSEARRCSHAEDGGPYAIQEQDGLNHHFDVWKWVGDSKLLTGDESSNLDELLDIHNLDA